MEPVVLESCHSIWLFDTDHMSFLRVLMQHAAGRHLAATSWRPYFGLEMVPHSESFVVILNAEGTRLLRSWRHTTHCAQCGGHATSEVSIEELRRLARVAG